MICKFQNQFQPPPFGEAAEGFTLVGGRYAASDIVNWDEVLTSSAFPELTLPHWEAFGKELPPSERLKSVGVPDEQAN